MIYCTSKSYCLTDQLPSSNAYVNLQVGKPISFLKRSVHQSHSYYPRIGSFKVLFSCYFSTLFVWYPSVSSFSDQLAAMPPLDSFMNIPANLRRPYLLQVWNAWLKSLWLNLKLCLHFTIQSIVVGDVVVGEITSVQDSGIAVNLLSFHSKKSRDFTDLDISVGKSYYPILLLPLDARFC